MSLTSHLTAQDIEQYLDEEWDAAGRTAMADHLTACPACVERVRRAQRLEAALGSLPRETAPQDLTLRIRAAVDLQTSQEKVNRTRIMWIAAATLFSALLLVWFALGMVFALQDDGTLDFISLFTSHPDVLTAYSLDAVLALLEALPVTEILLTLFTLLTVVVLAQQWVEAVRRSPGLYWNHEPPRR